MSNPGGPGVMYKIFSSENKKFGRKMFCHILWLDIVKFFSWQFLILWEFNLFTPLSIPLSNSREGLKSHNDPRELASWFAEWPPSQSKPSPCLTVCLTASEILSSIMISNEKNLAYTSTKSFFFQKNINKVLINLY